MSARPTDRAVIVVGAGIAGVTRAIEQAKNGKQVYLVAEGVGADVESGISEGPEASAALQGFRDRIQIISRAELSSVARADGRFRVKLRKRASRVLDELCNSCAACSRICPATMDDPMQYGLSSRAAIDSLTPGQGGYNIARNTPPCQEACPVHLDIRGYVGLAADGRYRESLALIRAILPFPGVIGRICTRPCETACNRGKADEPVAICALKRYVADWELQQGDAGSSAKPVVSPVSTGKKVAIIGSGPAGLSCACELARMGHGATVFESSSVVGGMLRLGIPEYRLPRSILDGEVALIEKAGVKVKTNTALGRDITVDGLLGEGYDAIFVAVGSHKGLNLGVPGGEGRGVIHGIDFLREVNLGSCKGVHGKVVVVGGGNVAIDSARCARRLGAAKVGLVYRRTRTEMPAHESEICAAVAEGIDITYLASPVEVLLGDGKVRGLRCVRMELGSPDRSGRRQPVPVRGSEFDIEADMVVPAVGQEVDTEGLENIGLDFTSGRLSVDLATSATSRKGVFGGGDAVTGPRSAIEAVAAGRCAAESIDRYLMTGGHE